jgi:FKBP-type peptidyl-prolyl cis-trans isomerase SlyD
VKIAQDTVVQFDYKLRDHNGVLIDEGEGDAGLVYLHGHGQIVPGLEKALDGKTSGEKVKAVVPPKEGYGEKQEDSLMRVPKADLPEPDSLEPGLEIIGETPTGDTETFWVVEVADDSVLLTSDHPLAGVELHFDVHVREVRAATAEEIEHGHAHDGNEHEHDH